MKAGYGIIAAMALLLASACSPRIELAMPKEPITINMNVRIEHDITIKADKQSTALLQPALTDSPTSLCPPAR